MPTHIAYTSPRVDVSMDASTTFLPRRSVRDSTSRHAPLGRSSSREGHIPRPPNCFLLFRNDYVDKHRSRKDEAKEVSQQAAEVWHCLTQEEKDFWVMRASEVKDEHASLYPNYKFQPKPRKHTSKKQNGRKGLRPDKKKPTRGKRPLAGRERVSRLPLALPDSWPDTGAQTIRGPSLPHMRFMMSGYLQLASAPSYDTWKGHAIANEVEDELVEDGNARQAEPPQSDNKPSAGKL
ncbi:hypothetical protein BDZ89DRAFT_214347 [Hymenopellis radicata]|nr:hypothetical protein BDZ89DRAFT_214347 [Hymenopellis radicata]